MSLADHMKTANAAAAADTSAASTDTTTEDTSTAADTTTEDTSTEDTSTDDTSADTSTEDADAEPKPSALFMSPVKDDKREVVPQVAKKEGVRAVIRKELEKEYEWTKSIGTKEDAARLVAFRDQLDRDPIRAVDRIVKALAADPVNRKQLIDYLETLYQPAAKKEAVDDDPMPEPDTAGGYTKEGVKKLNEWNQRQAVKMMRAEDAKTRTATTTRQAQEQRQHTEYATRAVALVQDQEGFKENSTEIAKVYNAYDRAQKYRGADEAKLLNMAYLQVMRPKWETTKADEARKQALADIRKKGGITTINPSTQSGTTTQAAPKTFKEVMVREAAKAKK